MRIISKRGIKDYYDYLQGTYGIDPLVVYDRRECNVIDPPKSHSEDYPLLFCDWFGTNIDCNDKPKERIRNWSSKSVKMDRKDMPRFVEEGRIMHFVLQVGYHLYLFEVERYLVDGELHIDHTLINSNRVGKDELFSVEPMSIVPCEASSWYTRKFNITKKDWRIDNPILMKSWVTKYITPDEIWNNLYEYISSLRDKEIVDTRTNDMHIESNGFDKKESFRGKIKRNAKRKGK